MIGFTNPASRYACCVFARGMTRQGPMLPEPDAIEDTFLSGSSLHRLGLNSAAEYWQARETGNYCMIQHKGTRFWIVRAQSTDAEPPSKLLVDKAAARSLVHLFYLGGEPLANALTKLGILELDGKKVSLRQLHYYFSCHAVVMQGELLAEYCPCCYKVTTFKRVCTCQTFVQRGKCPHAYFVAGLEGELDLEQAPAKKKPGRKRTTANAAPTTPTPKKRRT